MGIGKKKYNTAPQRVSSPIKWAVGAASLVSAGLAIHKKYQEIQNDQRRRALLADLHKNDPLLQPISEEQLLEWYATIYHVAPTFSLDKGAVKEVLENFARFGRVDINTLKMLADTEKSMMSAQEKNTPWSSLFSDMARGMSLGGAF